MRVIVAFLADFFRDPDNSSSMVRLVTFVLALDATAVTATIVAVALSSKASATVISALVAALTALVASGIVALYTRVKVVPTDAPAKEDN